MPRACSGVCPDVEHSVSSTVPRVPCLGVPPGLVLRERRGYSPCLPGLLRVPGLALRCLALRRLAGGLLGAGVRLDIFGGEGTLRGALAAVGALP